MTRASISLGVLLAGCSTSADAELSRLETDNAELASRVEALEGALSAEREATDAALAGHEAAIEALQQALDDEVAVLGTDLDGVDARVASLESTDLATQTWVNGRGFAAQSTLDTVSVRVNNAETVLQSHDSQLIALDAARTVHGARLDAAEDDLVTHTGVITSLVEVAGDLSDGIVANATALDTSFDLIADNADAIADNALAVSDNADDIAALSDEVADQALDILDNADAIADNGGVLATHGGTLSDHADDLSDHAGSLTSLGLSVDGVVDRVDGLELDRIRTAYPMILETRTEQIDAMLDPGLQGFVMQTNGGAFWQSGWIDAQDMQSNAVWWATFYVGNPAVVPVTVEWDFCRGDEAEVVIDGQSLGLSSDEDGWCVKDVSFELAPGAHTVQIRYTDPNNHFEGLGVRNSWITEYGLVPDWDGLNAALATAL